MRSDDLNARADYLVALIRKHGGWLDGDGETVRFPSVHKREAFDAELSHDHDVDSFSVNWTRVQTELEQE